MNCCTLNHEETSNMKNNDFNPEYMKLAADLSIKNIDEGGGPFGAVVVSDNEIVATGVNSGPM